MAPVLSPAEVSVYRGITVTLGRPNAEQDAALIVEKGLLDVPGEGHESVGQRDRNTAALGSG
jgi:hypothetical protein